MTDALYQSGKTRQVLRTRMLRRPIVFIHVRYSIPILLIKTVRCSIVRLAYHTVLYKIYKDVSNTTNLYYVFILLGQRVSILIESSSGPSKKTDPYLEGPEDDSIGIETCCPNTIKKKT